MALSRDFEERQMARQRQRRIEREKRRKLERIWLILLGILIILIIILCATRCRRNDRVTTAIPAETATQAVATVQTPVPTEAAASYGSIPAPTVGNNDLLSVIKASGQVRHIYLTFDEGPDPSVTPKILDMLRRYNVKGTFFVEGVEIEKYPYLVSRIMDEGHLVLPLSYSGNTDKLYADKNDFIDEVNKTYHLITDNSPNHSDPIKIYRFPGGSGANTTYGTAKQSYIEELAKNGYYFCDWNTTIGDENGTRTAEQLIQYFNDYRPNLNNLIIRMCNSSGHESTAEALGTLIKNLAGEGYIFSRLDEIDSSGAVAAAPTAATVSEQPAELPATAASPVPTTATGTTQTGTVPATTTQTGTVPATTTQTGTTQAGAPATGTTSAGNAQTGTAQTGTAQTGTAQTSTGRTAPAPAAQAPAGQPSGGTAQTGTAPAPAAQAPAGGAAYDDGIVDPE